MQSNVQKVFSDCTHQFAPVCFPLATASHPFIWPGQELVVSRWGLLMLPHEWPLASKMLRSSRVTSFSLRLLSNPLLPSQIRPNNLAKDFPDKSVPSIHPSLSHFLLPWQSQTKTNIQKTPFYDDNHGLNTSKQPQTVDVTKPNKPFDLSFSFLGNSTFPPSFKSQEISFSYV